MISTKDVLNKKFASGMFGYNKAEVDEFLNSVIDRMEADEQRIQKVNEELLEMQQKLSESQKLGDELKNTLILAQKFAEDVKVSAQAEAENHKKQIQQEAEAWVYDQTAQLEKAMQQVRDEEEKLMQRRETVRKEVTDLYNLMMEDGAQMRGDKVMPKPVVDHFQPSEATVELVEEAKRDDITAEELRPIEPVMPVESVPHVQITPPVAAQQTVLQPEAVRSAQETHAFAPTPAPVPASVQAEPATAAPLTQQAPQFMQAAAPLQESATAAPQQQSLPSFMQASAPLPSTAPQQPAAAPQPRPVPPFMQAPAQGTEAAPPVRFATAMPPLQQPSVSTAQMGGDALKMVEDALARMKQDAASSQNIPQMITLDHPNNPAAAEKPAAEQQAPPRAPWVSGLSNMKEGQ